MNLFRHLLKEARVVALPGYPFFGAKGENHIRFSYSTATSKLEEATVRITEAMERLS